MSVFIHETAEVSADASIGEGTSVWHQAQIRERARIGAECTVGKGVYIDFDVLIGNRCKLQNGVYVYHGATLEDGVFLGPGVMLLNDKNPRAINTDGSLKKDADWKVYPVHIGRGSAVGGGAVISPGVSLGCWASVGAGSVVTRNVPDHGLVYGNPARLAGYVCACGARMPMDADCRFVVAPRCSRCDVEVPAKLRTPASSASSPGGLSEVQIPGVGDSDREAIDENAALRRASFSTSPGRLAP
jgi:UDP-2-acetamido-3-amino-2,3-dideoxy-glucuronate N-acetyltransferase